MDARKGFIFTAIMALLTGATIWVICRNISPQDLLAAVEGAKYRWLAAGFSLMLLYVALEGLCIRMTMKTMGERTSLWSSVKYSFIGFYFSGITPSASGGQPAQVFCMGRDRLNLSKSALCLLLISSIYQISMLLYGAGIYFMQHTFLKGAVLPVRWLLLLGSALNLVLVAAILFMMFSPKIMERILLLCVGLLEHFPKFQGKQGYLKDKIHGLMGDYGAGADYIRKNPGLVLQLFAITIARLTIMYLMPYFVARSFGLSGHTAFQMVGLQAMLTLAVSSLPFPGSVGISEGTSLLLFGVMFSTGLLIPSMLLVRVISFYAVLCASGLVLAGDAISRPSRLLPARR